MRWAGFCSSGKLKFGFPSCRVDSSKAHLALLWRSYFKRCLGVMEVTIQQCTARVMRLSRVRNDSSSTTKVRCPLDSCDSYVLRERRDTARMTDLNLEVSEKRPRGRPKQLWLDTLHLDF